MKDSNKFGISPLTENEKGQLKGGFKKLDTLSVKSVALPNTNCYGASDIQSPDDEAANTNCIWQCNRFYR